MKLNLKTLPLWLAGGLIGIGFPFAVVATGTYSALSSLSVTVTDSQGALVIASGREFGRGSEATGDASATVTPFYEPDTPTALADGESLTVVSETEGTATNGDASSFLFSEAEITLENAGAQSVTVTLDYAYRVEATANVQTPALEDARAFADIDVGGDVPPEVWSVAADALNGPTAPKDSGSGQWQIVVAPGAVNVISISGLVDTDGAAEGVTPTFALISSFGATARDGRVLVEWETSAELGTIGFHLERSDAPSGEFERLNDELLLGLLVAPRGGEYSYLDATAVVGRRYSYRLLEVDARGGEREYGPYEVRVRPERRTRRAGRGRAAIPPAVVAAPASVEDRGPVVDPGIPGYQRRAKPRPARSRGAEVRQDPGAATLDAASLLTQPASLSAAVPPAGEPQTLARVLVEAGGVYEIGADALAAALGQPLDAVIDLLRDKQLSLTHRGETVGWEALRLGAGLRFHAQALGEMESNLYSETNVYWLELGAQSPGMDWVMGIAPRQAADAGALYPADAGWEENYSLLPFASDDPDDDFWMWALIYVSPSSVITATLDGLETPAAAGSGEAVLRVELKGAADTNGPDPDHHVVVKVNGTEVSLDNPQWDGLERHSVEARFDQSLLNPSGANSIEVGGALLAGVPYSYFWVDRLDLTYWRGYVAESDVGRVKAGEGEVVSVSGFSCGARDLAVYDISDPRWPRVYRERLLKRDIPGEVSFNANGGSEFLTLCQERMQTPQLQAATATDWLAADNDYDYVVIAPKELLAGAQALADYRAGMGYKSALFDLQELYDACNGGITDARAIKDCLAWAYDNWQGVPLFAVLVGEGTLDPKDYQGYGENRLPVRECTTPWGLYPCDNWYVDLDDDGVPEIAIGRVPVSDNAEMFAYVDKVDAYEAGRGGGSGEMLWVADNPDAGGDFHGDSDLTAALAVSAGHVVEKVYYEEPDPPTSSAIAGAVAATRGQILAALEAGPELFHWSGHGGPGQMAGEKLFVLADAWALENTRTPILVALTCTVGYGAYPDTEALVETLVARKTGPQAEGGHGAVAAFAPSGLSLNLVANLMDEVFIDALYGAADAATLGEAALMAVEAVGDSPSLRFMRDIYQIWGDPALVPWR